MLTITPKEVDDFDRAILAACILKSEHRLDDERDYPTVSSPIAELPDYFYRDEYLVISFDVDWYPFLDNTRGYHGDNHERWYIPRKNRMIAEVAAALRKNSSRTPGGRVFVNPNGAVRQERGRGQVQLLTWQLMKESRFMGSRRVTSEKLWRVQHEDA